MNSTFGRLLTPPAPAPVLRGAADARTTQGSGAGAFASVFQGALAAVSTPAGATGPSADSSSPAAPAPD
ncbi:MAG: ABC transporter ATP-binding protein, partial [Ramlibacter sp.]|nr:ABC transporter ATP-binding protein [Cryobacterium sp.]